MSDSKQKQEQKKEEKAPTPPNTSSSSSSAAKKASSARSSPVNFIDGPSGSASSKRPASISPATARSPTPAQLRRPPSVVPRGGGGASSFVPSPRVALSMSLFLLIAIATAFVAWKLSKSADLERLQLFASLYDEFGTSEMLDSYLALERFYERAGKQRERYRAAFIRETRVARSDVGHKIFHAERRIFHWWRKLVLLQRMGGLDAEHLRAWPGRQRARIFDRLLRPLSTIAAADRDQNTIFAAVHALFGIDEAAAASAAALEKAASGSTSSPSALDAETAAAAVLLQRRAMAARERATAARAAAKNEEAAADSKKKQQTSTNDDIGHELLELLEIEDEGAKGASEKTTAAAKTKTINF